MNLRAGVSAVLVVVSACAFGCEGPVGPAGPEGPTGTGGPTGTAGTTGATGPEGAPGTAGPAGAVGETLAIDKIVNCSGSFDPTNNFFIAYQATLFTSGDLFVTASVARATDGFFVRGARWYKPDGMTLPNLGAVLMDSDGYSGKNAGNFTAKYDTASQGLSVVVDDLDVNGGTAKSFVVTRPSGSVCSTL